MKKHVLVGIDVSAASLDVALDRGRGPVATGNFENDPGGHRKLLRMLTKRAADGWRASGSSRSGPPRWNGARP